MTEFKQLDLHEKILSALEKKGYTTPTPIQLQAIPHILEGKDLMGIAQTGTGKTAAFSLPILNNLTKSNVTVLRNNVRCLILTPTRELASQIAENIEGYGKDLHLKHTVIFGGVNENPQIQKLGQGMDIVIATPGRLLDLMGQNCVRFSQIEILVLDEADRMLDMGFINDVKKIIARMPEKRQTLFFSATMSPEISRLAHNILKSPVKVEVTPASSTVDRIAQKIMFVEKSNKMPLLKSLLKQDEVEHVLVFSQTKHGANKVVELLQKHGIEVAAIHGNKSQSAREKALSDFRSGKVQVLIATDIAARGIDVPGISHVINYDIPQDPENYVHRIGRTARAGRKGVAISFCDNSERHLLSTVEKLIKMKIPVDETHPYHGVAAAPGEPRRLSKSSAPRGGARSGGNAGRSDDRRGNRLSSGSAARPSGNRAEGHTSEGRPERRGTEGRSFENRNRTSETRSTEPRSSEGRTHHDRGARTGGRSESSTGSSDSSLGNKLKSFFGFGGRKENSGRKPAGNKRPYSSKNRGGGLRASRPRTSR